MLGHIHTACVQRSGSLVGYGAALWRLSLSLRAAERFLTGGSCWWRWFTFILWSTCSFSDVGSCWKRLLTQLQVEPHGAPDPFSTISLIISDEFNRVGQQGPDKLRVRPAGSSTKQTRYNNFTCKMLLRFFTKKEREGKASHAR